MENGHVFLIGMMGSGKTTVGRLVAGLLGRSFADTDDLVEGMAGLTPGNIIESRGEPHFRELEREAIRQASRSDVPLVISTGGGAVLDERNIAEMRARGRIYWLDAAPEELERRVSDGAGRPLWVPGNAAGVLAVRQPAYLRSCDTSVDTTGRSPGDVAGEIARLHVSTGIVHELAVQADGRQYPILMGSGLLGRLPFVVEPVLKVKRALVVTNETVAPLYLKSVMDGFGEAEIRAAAHIVPDGEAFKSLTVLQGLYDWGIEEKADRQTAVVALGGGVVGDLAGFFAATLLRGLPLIQVPTTVIAQIDSSIGGKVAVNHERGKNLIGAFYQPAVVVADLDTLRTLPEREIISGMAEVIKHALIRDQKYFAFLEEKIDALLKIDRLPTMEAFARSCRIKSAVVSEDPREQGVRAILNFGHTIGHAIEAAAGYGRYRHGEAVAMGMVAAARISERLGMLTPLDRAKVEKLIERAGLPGSPIGVDPQRIEQAIRVDKKAAGGRPKWVLLNAIGKAVYGGDVPDCIWHPVVEEMTSGT